MKIALRIFAYIASTYFIGGTIANTYLNWPMDMPDWLHASVMFAIRVTGLGGYTTPTMLNFGQWRSSPASRGRSPASRYGSSHARHTAWRSVAKPDATTQHIAW
ncbi:hypothetical protein [Paraburkholderia sp. 2C]